MRRISLLGTLEHVHREEKKFKEMNPGKNKVTYAATQDESSRVSGSERGNTSQSDCRPKTVEITVDQLDDRILRNERTMKAFFIAAGA